MRFGYLFGKFFFFIMLIVLFNCFKLMKIKYKVMYRQYDDVNNEYIGINVVLNIFYNLIQLDN